jgi:gliding motility associated protien GldN
MKTLHEMQGFFCHLYFFFRFKCMWKRKIPVLFYLSGSLLLTAFTVDVREREQQFNPFSATCTTGVFVPGNQGKKYIPYTYLRQADVAWEKRIWRMLDLKEKINLPLMYPVNPTSCRRSLIDVVRLGLMNNTINAFTDDEFKEIMTGEQVLSKLVKERSVPVYDSLGDVVGNTLVKDTLTSEKITRLRIKEDWYFDRQKSALEVRILGMGFDYYDEQNGVYISVFWIYYSQCRQLFSTYEVFNTKNDAERRTYDEVFQKRMFNSFITQESNVFERPVDAYSKGLDALIEAERIKGDIFRWEHDLWHF